MDIRIFVSHRIDLDAELIDNPIYVPVRCGAVYDRREGVTMQGDDTGDNISQRRMSFSEFTVQYWAWKNTKTDYAGLCHYRRYLSFAGRRFRANVQNMIVEQLLTRRAKVRHGLLDAQGMAAEIARYDAIVPEPPDITKLPTHTGDQATNIRELWAYHAGLFVDERAVDNLLERIDRIAPEYSESARAYFAGDKHIGYNCYVMKRELFDRLCEFQFPILFDLEKALPGETLEAYPRIIGYMGEMLFGVFVHHLMTVEHANVGYKKILFAADAKRITQPVKAELCVIRYRMIWLLQIMVEAVFPRGSGRRAFLKSVFYKKR